MGRFDNVKALLSATPPLAVRLNLRSDVLEESALRSTTNGTLSLAIAGLESRIAPHREKLAAGRMLPAAAFAGGDEDLSKLKALKEVACMIKKQGSVIYRDACIMLVHERSQFYSGLNAALPSSQQQLTSPRWDDKRAGLEMLARLPLIRVPLDTFGPNGGRNQSLLLPIIPGMSDAELLEHIALVKELREAREAARRRGDAFDAAKFKLLIGAQPPSARAAIEYIVVKTAGDEVARELGLRVGDEVVRRFDAACSADGPLATVSPSSASSTSRRRSRRPPTRQSHGWSRRPRAWTRLSSTCRRRPPPTPPPQSFPPVRA